MLIFRDKVQEKYYVFIHIPKTGGTNLRNQITKDPRYEIIHHYWYIKEGLDLAHIPYIKSNEFINHAINKKIEAEIEPELELELEKYSFFAYTRNPYDRIISSFFYKNPYENPNGDNQAFKHFIKNTLTTYVFSSDFDFSSDIIHYYPQYLFVCDYDKNIKVEINTDLFQNNKTATKYKLEHYFDEECIEIINRIYIHDFIFFGYEIIIF